MPLIQAGMSEREIAAELEWFMRRRAQKKPLLTPLSPVAGVGRAARQSQRQDCCSGRVCHSRFGALYQGYCSDMTRTLLVNGEG